MPIFYLDSGSIDNLTVSSLDANANLAVSAGTLSSNVSQLVFSNSNNVTFGLDGSTITATADPSINISAGTTSNNVSQLVFSNANGVSFGLDGSTITATINPSAAAVESYYRNIDVWQGTGNTLTLGGSSNFVQPFNLPYDISISYLRVLLSNSFGSTTLGSTQNTTIAMRQTQTWFANIYSAGTGANSFSLQQVAGSQATMVMGISHTLGANTNQQTVSQAISYPVTGSSATFGTSYNPGASINVSTTQLTQFNTNRFLDIPFATSLPAGAYWIAFQRSTATATTGGTQFTGCTHNNSYYFVTQFNSNFAQYGNASNVSTNNLQPGLGYWSTNANGSTSVSLALSHISTVASQPQIPFQFLRFA